MTAKNMLTQMYSYGTTGSLVKMGGDLTYSVHLLTEKAQGPNNPNKYQETKDRFDYMHQKMNYLGEYGNPWSGNNNAFENFIHATGGYLFPPQLWYDMFEVWGENYVRWELVDRNHAYQF